MEKLQKEFHHKFHKHEKKTVVKESTNLVDSIVF
jgi:hypothetical protein